MFPEMLSLIDKTVSEELRNHQTHKTDGQIDISCCINTKKIMKRKGISLRDLNLKAGYLLANTLSMSYKDIF